MDYVTTFCEFWITYWITSQFEGTPCGEAQYLLRQQAQDSCTHIRASVQGIYSLKRGGVYIRRGDTPRDIDGRQTIQLTPLQSVGCDSKGRPGMRTTPVTDVWVVLGRTRSNHRCCYNNRYRYHGQGISAHQRVLEILMTYLSSLAS
jgi:hypothetical protein